MQSNELKKNIIKLLKEDEEFRYTVAGLIGYDAILKSLDEHTKRFEAHDKKFNEILKRLDEHDRKFNVIMQRLDEHDRKFNVIMQRLDEHTRILNEHTKLLQRLDVRYGSLSRRIGRDLELTILNIYKDQLMQLGIDPDKARRFEYKDEEGKYGLKGKRYEFDIVISNTHADIIEVKSHAEEEDVVFFYEKVNNIKDVLIKEFNDIGRLIIVAVDIDEEALAEANRLGIKTVYGCVITRD